MGISGAGNIFDTVGGLPVHVLVVHAVVVLLPLCGVGAICMGFFPRFSLRFGPLVWIGAAACVGLSFVAQKSGLALAQRVGTPARHYQLGELVKYYAAALAIVALVLWIVDRQSGGDRTLMIKIIAALVIFTGIAAIYGAYMAGESGSKAVWQAVVEDTPPAK